MRLPSAAVLIDMHAELIADHGGAGGLRDRGRLDAALARPLQMLSYRDAAPSLAELAAALGAGICRNHPFVDGNKRVALLSVALMLDLNGPVLDAKESEAETVVRRLADGSLSEATFAAWIAANATTEN